MAAPSRLAADVAAAAPMAGKRRKNTSLRTDPLAAQPFPLPKSTAGPAAAPVATSAKERPVASAGALAAPMAGQKGVATTAAGACAKAPPVAAPAPVDLPREPKTLPAVVPAPLVASAGVKGSAVRGRGADVRVEPSATRKAAPEGRPRELPADPAPGRAMLPAQAAPASSPSVSVATSADPPSAPAARPEPAPRPAGEGAPSATEDVRFRVLRFSAASGTASGAGQVQARWRAWQARGHAGLAPSSKDTLPASAEAARTGPPAADDRPAAPRVDLAPEAGGSSPPEVRAESPVDPQASLRPTAEAGPAGDANQVPALPAQEPAIPPAPEADAGGAGQAPAIPLASPASGSATAAPATPPLATARAHSAETAAPARPATPVVEAWRPLLEQLQGRVERLALAEGGSATLRLEPGGLGSLELTLERTGEAWRLDVRASSPETLRLVENQARELHDSLSAVGVKLEEMRLAQEPAARPGAVPAAPEAAAQAASTPTAGDADAGGSPSRGRRDEMEPGAEAAAEPVPGEEFASRLERLLRESRRGGGE